MSSPLKLPLNDFHAEQGARFVPFGGWQMPVQYSGILDEHKAVRTTAGLFDVSHMGEFSVTGADANRFLDRLLVNRIEGISAGRAIYSPMCNSNGGVVDDLIVYCLEPDAFLVCVNASNIEKDFGWFLKQAKHWAFDVEIEDHSDKYALLALQGPKSERILSELEFENLNALKRFHHIAYKFGSGRIRICRTGYTGEDGFEIYVPIKLAERLATQIIAAGKNHGLKLCGLGSRDSLRLEAGLPLYGHELSDTISPLEASLDWTVKFKKLDFIGKNALLEQKESGVPRRLIHFRLEGRRIAREGSEVFNSEGNNVGYVCSGTLSPMINAPIGSALVKASALDDPLHVDLRGNKLSLEVTAAPLHKITG